MSSLDADLRRRMRDVLFGVRDQFDLTFVHVTHDQAEATGDIRSDGRHEERSH